MIDDTERFKRECFARYVLKNWTRTRIEQWLAKQTESFRDDIRRHLNVQRKLLKETGYGQVKSQ